MNPPCAKCKKTVYPTEKLNCLDKVWHKACFRCETCNLKLTMKNYKGYNKLPYCNTHYPTTKFTSVADTPEQLRLKKQTANQSQLTYQKDHRENLGKFTAVSDDPESLRLMKASQQASHVAYKGPATAPGLGQAMPSSQPQYAPDPVQTSYQPQAAPPQMPPPQMQAPPVQQPPPPSMSQGPRYVAVYDYAAADDDEVSFSEGDVILDVEVIDQGWMTGRVERTGESGMLPSNYVEVQ